MRKYVYVGNSGRVFLYPNAFHVEPGDVVEADRNPDFKWFVPVDFEKPKPSPADEEE